jgi:2',3'-cyclic-nucleotide 2'-phosphodiesterase (5'-nucleotidase family)
MVRRWLYLFVLLCFIACKGDADIIILCTNDMHGSVDNFPKIAAYYKTLKARNPNTFLFSAGDLFSGNPLVDLYPENGYPMIDIMNRTGYCLSSLGNHEFDYGQDNLNRRMRDANFPFICANIDFSDKPTLQPVAPYKIFKIGRVKLAVLGLLEIGSDGIPSAHPDKLAGLRFMLPETALKNFAFLQRNDIFALLAHTGVEWDVKIAPDAGYVDLILGGHSHTVIKNGRTVNGVLITQAGSNLQYISETHISVRRGKITGKSNRLVDVKTLTDEDAEIRQLIDNYKANDAGNEVIGEARETISGTYRLGALMTDALVDVLKLDIAFQNTGGVRLNKIPRGNITVNTVNTLDPFRNEVVKMEMTYDELEYFLLQNYSKLIVSGLRCVVHKDRGEVEIFDRHGRPLDKSRTYLAGMNSYIYSTFQFVDKSKATTLDVITSDILIQYIRQLGSIGYANVARRIVVK